MRTILFILTSAFVFTLMACSAQVDSIETDVTELNLDIEETATIELTILPETSTANTVTWESLDLSIATINDDGQVTAQQAGRTTIVVTVDDVQAQVDVVVNELEEPEIPAEPNDPDPDPVAVSVEQVEEIDVPFGSTLEEVVALLPTGTSITDDLGNTYVQPLDWVVYNYVGDDPQFAPARYVASGLFDVPEGVAAGNIRTQVDTYVNLGIGLADIAFPEEFRVSLGTSLEDTLALLDDTALITDSVGNQSRVEVRWQAPSDYDPDIINGIFEFTGILQLPEGISGSDALPAEMVVPVKIVAAGDIRYGITTSDIDEIDVSYGTTLSDALDKLPTQITIIDNEDTEHIVAVNWVIYDFVGDDPRLAPGRFLAEGFYQLPEGFRYGALPRTLETYINLEAPTTE